MCVQYSITKTPHPQLQQLELDVFWMPVLVGAAMVGVRNYLGAVPSPLTSDVETFQAVFHDAITGHAPLLKRLVFERHHLNLIVRS